MTSKTPVGLMEFRELAARVEAGEELLCRDLEALGIPGFAHHDPRRQSWDEEPCPCCADLVWEDDSGYVYEHFYEGARPCQRRHHITGGGLSVVVCCGCWSAAELSAAKLVAQIKEALSCL